MISCKTAFIKLQTYMAAPMCFIRHLYRYFLSMDKVILSMDKVILAKDKVILSMDGNFILVSKGLTAVAKRYSRL